MKKVRTSFSRVLVIVTVLNVATNLVHPVTPTLIEARGLPDYMFGVFFAAMALGSLVIGPVWGRISDRHGRLPVLVGSTAGYALAQLGFGLIPNPAVMLAMRFLGGCTVMGSTVCLMASAVDTTEEGERARKLSWYAAAMGVAMSVGYFIGGIVGSYSMEGTFYLQAAMLAAVCVMMALYLGETHPPERRVASERQSNRKRISLGSLKGVITLPMLLFLIGVSFAQFGASGYDNAFNYYLLKELHYNPSVNGLVKGVTGLIGLVANLTINAYIIRRFKLDKALSAMLFACSVMLVAVVLAPDIPWFFATNVIFYIFNTMFVPIQQALAARQKDSGHGLISGLYNSFRSMGMMAGALAAGFLYELSPTLPFIWQSVGYAAAAAVTIGGYAVIVYRNRNLQEVSRL